MPDNVSGQCPGNYGRHRRIVKTDEFSSVFRLRPAFRTEHFALYQRPNNLGHARLGVVVAKRLAARAVTRNMIKRLVRELFRTSALPAIDCIIRLSAPVVIRSQTASSKTCKTALATELKQLLSNTHLKSSPPAR